MTITAEIIEDSVSEFGIRIVTMELEYPRFIHSEFMTHRMFSRNASSSRAIPVAKMIAAVRANPAMPIHWGKNQPGMQANEEIQHVGAAKDQWMRAANNAADLAQEMNDLGLHKQVANRILEPFQHIKVIVTATEWYNFFLLRAHPDAQPEIHALALEMQSAMAASTPILLKGGEWHLPYVSDWERDQYKIGTLLKMSAARCARVSYLTHDGKTPNIEKDLALYDQLITSTPMHASPVEHQATPLKYLNQDIPTFSGNFLGWYQYRKAIESSLGGLL